MENEPYYYLRRRGQVVGPWPLRKVRGEVKLRKLGRHDEVSEDGEIWSRAGDIEGLLPKSSEFKKLANSDTEHISDTETQQQEEPQSTPSQGAIWYYSPDPDKELGPITILELVEAVFEGRCPLDSMVWKEGMEDWAPLESISEIKTCLEASGSEEGGTAATRIIQVVEAKVNKKPAVALACGLGSLLLSFVPMFGFLGIAAIVIGILAIRELKNHEGSHQKHFILAGIGIASGALAILVAIAVAIGVIVWLTG